jgi:hypothetical protein
MIPPADDAERSQLAGRRPLAWALASLFLVLSFHFTLAASSSAPDEYDEGFVLADAMRIAHGEVPYRDFDPAYGPLESLTLALPVRLAGPELMLLRLVRVVAAAGTICVICASAWGAGARALALLAGGLALSLSTAFLTHSALGTGVLALAATPWALTAGEPRSRRRRLSCVGLLVGVTAALRYDFGAFVGVGAAAALAIDRLVARAPGRARATMHDAGAVAIGLVPCGAVYLTLFALTGAARLRQLVQDLTDGAAGDTRRLPLPFTGPEAPCFYATVGVGVVLLSGLPLILREGWRARRASRLVLTVVAYGASFAGFCLYGSIRPDRYHLFPALAVGAVGAAALLGSTTRPRAVLTAGAGLLLSGLVLARTAQSVATWSQGTPIDVRGVRGLRTEDGSVAAAVYSGLRDAVARAAGPGEPVFVGCERHDLLTYNDALAYCILDRPIPTRWHRFNPGFTTTEAVQRAMIDELTRRNVRVVVRRLGTFFLERNASARPGSRVLDRWIDAHFRRFAVVRRAYVVLVRRD